MPDEPDITQHLIALRDGDRDALSDLLPLVYERLKRMARGQLEQGGIGKTLSATALVHEAYLRLVDQERAEWVDRGHFFAVAARAMRQIAVDHARRRGAGKRGGDAPPVVFDEVEIDGGGRPSVDALDLDRALRQLAERSERLVRVVELRHFAGLTVEEVADVLGVTARTVKRDWNMARAFLMRALRLDRADP